jgi:dolichol-phosphate mannosyltransferase
LSDSLVIIPTYNELENIERMLNTVFLLAHPFHVLIVDDGSPDGTAQIVKNLQSVFPGRLHLLERSGKLGLGTAYIAGFKWGLANNYNYIFEMDADFSHNPQDLIRLYEACASDRADLAVGSRYTRGGKVSNWSLDRMVKWAAWVLQSVAKFVTAVWPSVLWPLCCLPKKNSLTPCV